MSDVNGEVGKAKKTRTDYGITDAEFVEAWQTSHNADEVARRLTQLSRSKGKIGPDKTMSKNIVQARAAVYRSKNVSLKKMDKRNPRRLDVEKLNEQIKGLNAPAPV